MEIEEQQGVAPEQEVQEQVVAPTTEEQQPQQIVEDEMPSEPDKQREAFIEMRRKLKEQEEIIKSTQAPREEEFEVINQFRSGNFAPNREPVTPDTDLDVFAQRVNQAEQVAYQSNSRISELERQLEDQKLFSEFPELNPKSEESKKPEAQAFEEFVAGKAALQIMQGKKPDLVAIARKAKEAFSGLTQSQKDAITQEVTQNIQTKENATLEARGTSFIQPQDTDYTELNRRINRGDHDALTERLKGIL